MTGWTSRYHRPELRRRLLSGGKPPPSRLILRRTQRALRRAAQHHPVLAVARIVAGWLVIAVGVCGVVLPLLPAVVLIPAGVALVGKRSTPIRWCRTRGKLFLRRAEMWPGWPGRLGRLARNSERRFASAIRHWHMRRRERATTPPG